MRARDEGVVETGPVTKKKGQKSTTGVGASLN